MALINPYINFNGNTEEAFNKGLGANFIFGMQLDSGNTYLVANTLKKSPEVSI